MAEFFIQLVFSGLDLENEEVVQALGEMGIVTAEPLENDLARLTSVVKNHDAVTAAHEVFRSVVQKVPTASPEWVDRDLVGVTDIAERVGVTREAVRHWSRGRRGPGNFPTPIGAPSGSSIWEWSSVHAWLRHNLGMWDGLDMPNTHQLSQIDADIDRFNGARRGQSSPRTNATIWRSAARTPSSGRLSTGRQVLFSKQGERWAESPVEPKRDLVPAA